MKAGKVSLGKTTRPSVTSALARKRLFGMLDRDIPVAWVTRWAAAKPTVRGLEKNKQGEYVVEDNIYFDMLPHIYMVEKA